MPTAAFATCLPESGLSFGHPTRPFDPIGTEWPGWMANNTPLGASEIRHLANFHALLPD